MPGVEKIIHLCKSRFRIDIDGETEKKAEAFITRQMESPTGYEQPRAGQAEGTLESRGRQNMQNVLANKLCLFLYQTGEIEINAGNGGQGRRIGRTSTGDMKEPNSRIEDIKLLALGNSKIESLLTQKVHDKRLSRLVDEVFHWGGFWTDYIEEVGRDEAVVQYFGRPITTEDLYDVPKGQRGRKPASRKTRKQKKTAHRTRNKATTKAKRRRYEAPDIREEAKQEYIPAQSTQETHTAEETEEHAQQEYSAAGKKATITGNEEKQEKEDKTGSPAPRRTHGSKEQELRKATHYIDVNASNGLKTVTYFYTRNGEEGKYRSSQTSVRFTLDERVLNSIDDVKALPQEGAHHINADECMYKAPDGSIWIGRKFDPETDENRRCIYSPKTG